MSRVLVIGMFDGLHIGHQELIKRAVQEADERYIQLSIVTFATHPADILRPESAPKKIMRDQDRLNALQAFPGVTNLEVLDFTPELQQLSGPAFIQSILKNKFEAEVVVVGENFRFGSDAAGDVNTLRENIETIVPELVQLDGVTVSSTQVRSAIATGHVQKTRKMLGHYHSLKGIIIHGDRRGRTIGFPTANFDIPDYMAVPANGVYAGYMQSPSHHNVQAAISIGHNTTFGGTKELRVEGHFLDFDEELYGQELELQFVERLRGQERYSNVRALIDQLHHDCERTRDCLEIANSF